MTTIGSSLEKPPGALPLIKRTHLEQVAGLVKLLTRAEFDIAVTTERARIVNSYPDPVANMYAEGEQFFIVGEVGYRTWTIGTGGTGTEVSTSSHAKKVTLRPGLVVTLAGDANTVTTTAGAPSGGNDGDVKVDYAANRYYVRTAGVWDAGTAIYVAGTDLSTPWTSVGAQLTPMTAIAIASNAGVIDWTKNVQSVENGDDTTLTLAVGSPGAGTNTTIVFRNSDTVNYTKLTFPSAFSEVQQTNIISVLVPPSGRVTLAFFFDGTIWHVYGDSGYDSNFNGVGAPTVSDDVSKGYGLGSFWLTSTNSLYICKQNTVGAAVWVQAAGGASGGGAISLLTYNTTDKSLISQDRLGNTPVNYSPGDSTIDIQALRTDTVGLAYGARSPGDVVLGNQSGLRTNRTQNGKDILIHGTATGRGATYGGGQSLVIHGSRTPPSNLATIDRGRDVIIGNNLEQSVGGNIAISSPEQPFIYALSGTGKFNYNTIVGNVNITMPVNQDIAEWLHFGAQNTINISDGNYANITMFGQAITLESYSSGIKPSIMFVGGYTEWIEPVGASMRIGFGGVNIDFIGDLTIQAAGTQKLLRLGAYDPSAISWPSDSTNVAIVNALAFEGTAFIASAASVQIPDNVSRVILTGTTNSAITFPDNPIHGQELIVAFDGAQTPTWAAGSGKTLRNAPSGAVAAGASYQFQFNQTVSSAGAVTNAWYRIR